MNRLPLALLLLPVLLSLTCSPAEDGQCADGEDNDGDGLIDMDDSGCLRAGDSESPDAAPCEDTIDNDGDGLIDLEDPGCEDSNDKDEYNEPDAACADGIDNDSDGLVDFPNDPGCTFAVSDSEEDDCPDGESCPACSNGVDDDEDGMIDYPDDLGCNSSGDSSEVNLDPSQCGLSVLIQPLPEGGIMGQFMDGNTGELQSPDCGGDGQEHVYVYTATAPEALVITTDFAETTFDTVLYVRGDCDDSSTELGCNDDNGANERSTMTIDRVEPGSYFIVLDGATTGASGDYRLEVEAFTPAGEACDVDNDTCIAGLVCRNLNDAATMPTCELPECEDGQDNDADGLTDFPDEPGCSSPDDNTELDDCPDGPGCPACSNEVDDDGDGLIDLGLDPGCTVASDASEIDECVPGLETLSLDAAGASGATTGTSLLSPQCSSATGPEAVYVFEHDTNLTQLSFSSDGSMFDVALSVRLDDCATAGAELACAEDGVGDETVSINAPTQGNYFVIVDGVGTGDAGDYVLNVSGIIPENEPCDAADTQFLCDASIGLLCQTGTCQHSQCSDGVDNGDGDGLADFLDPGCETITDDTEGPNPTPDPQCFDTVDNDGNGLTDFPDDPGCSKASDDLELACTDSDPLVDVVGPALTGDTNTATNDFTPSCSTFSTGKNDIVHTLSFPGSLESLQIDTENSSLDTVLYIKQDDCAQADLACDDDGGVSSLSSLISLTNVAAGNYFIVVDGFGSSTGGAPYNLNISGVIAAGQACDAAQVSAGLFTCSGGGACTAGVCQ